MNTIRPSTRIRLCAAAAGIAGALLYANTWRNDFVFDDIRIARDNALAHDPAALAPIFLSHYWAGVLESGNLYRPLTIWSLALNHRFTGSGPAGYHVTNLVLHGLNSGIVVLLGAALGLGPGPALAAGLLFASHPVHVEAVAPVVGRSELLAALFVILAWLCHLEIRRRSAPREAPGSRSRRDRAVAWLLHGGIACFFAAGLLSKENAVVLIALAGLSDLVRRGPRITARRRWGPFITMAAVLALYLIARAAVLHGMAPSDIRGSVFGRVGALTRVLTAVGVLGRYLLLLVFPVTLSADYSWYQIPMITPPGDTLFLVSAIACSFLLAAGAWLAIRRRVAGLSILAYFAALFPVSNLAFSTGTQMAERLLYLPSLGLCLFLPAAFAESDLARSRGARRLAIAVACLAVAALGARTLVRNGDWVDQYTLFSRTAETSPRSAKAHYGFGEAAAERGDTVRAIEEYRRAIEIKPDMPEPRRNLGLELLRAGSLPEAEEQLERAAALDPSAPDVHNDLGLALEALGRSREAVASFETELRLRPEGKHANLNLGRLLLDMGRPLEALPYLARATALAPEDPDAQGRRVMALAVTGRGDEAIAALDDAIRASPAFKRMLGAYAQAALKVGQRDLAREAARRAEALPH